MAGRFKAAVIRSIPWLLFGSVLLPALGSAIAGILVLVFWRQAGDIALGILVIVMGLAVIAGTFTSLGLLLRQNRMARAQADFIAQVSHELRTPVASIMMGIETLKNDRFHSEDERRTFLDMLDTESRRLGKLIEMAIGYQVAARNGSRQESAEPEPATACASQLVSEAIAGFAMNPDTRDCIRFLPCHENGIACSDLIAVDRDRFIGAIKNLVANALTHGQADRDNPVDITIGWREDKGLLHEVLAPFGEVFILIKDCGPGINRQDIDHIFRKFHRGRQTSDGGPPGLGLGLAIVREFASTSGGVVTVESEPGSGALFKLTLPRHGDADDASER